MADRNALVAKPIWVKQAEEAKLKSEAEKAAAAKAAFGATFKDPKKNREAAAAAAASDSDSEDGTDLANKPIGSVDPARCMAAGAGIAGGTACAPSVLTVVTKDADGSNVPHGGASIRVKVSPGVGVGGSEQEGIVKDMGDGTYSVTYIVPKRGDYMVTIECNGKAIMGSPFPVFFSAGTSNTGLLGSAPPSSYPNPVNQTMPNMPNYAGSVSGSFPGLLGMIPGVVSGANAGAILPGIGASLGEVCREYLNGRCIKSDCKLNHPPHNLLMAALDATTSMGSLNQVSMAPSAAAMAAAQAIVAAQALQAHAAQFQAQAQANKDSSDSPDKAGKGDALKRTLQVSNLSPVLPVEKLKQHFAYCGTVVDCTITDSKHFAYIEYSKPEEANAALAMNNMDICGCPLNVEMAKTLPQKSSVSGMTSSSLPMMMQQAVAMQQMQFQQALLMQQTLTAQQAANKAANMKSATELAAARAAEISRKLKADGLLTEEMETIAKSRSPSGSSVRPKSKSRSPARRSYRRRSRSNSTSPINYRRRSKSGSKSPVSYRQKSRSRSPISYWKKWRSPSHSPPRHRSSYRSKSPKSHYRSSNDSQRQYHRDSRDSNDWNRRHYSERSYDHYSSVSRRNLSRSPSPHKHKSSKMDSDSPKRYREDSPHDRKRDAIQDGKLKSHSRRPSPRKHKSNNVKRNRDFASTVHTRKEEEEKPMPGSKVTGNNSRVLHSSILAAPLPSASPPWNADDSQMRFGGKIVYSKTKSEVEEAALGMKRILEDKKREAGTVAIGFDIEWKPAFRKGVLPGKAAVVQICFDRNFCHVMHIIHSGIPPTLPSLLEDPSLLKVGVGIDDDGVKMYKDHKVCLKSLKDLSCLANQKLGGVPRQWGLKSLTEMLLSKKLAKTKKISCGNWAAYSLSKKQLEYAATDAFASWLLYEVLKGYPDAEDKDVKSTRMNFDI